MMRKVWRWVRKFWWALLLGVGVLFAVLWYALGGRHHAPAGLPPPPSFADKARHQVEKIRLEGEVEKARITARADAQREEIDRIEELGEDDPKEARRQLADLLRRTL